MNSGADKGTRRKGKCVIQIGLVLTAQFGQSKEGKKKPQFSQYRDSCSRQMVVDRTERTGRKEQNQKGSHKGSHKGQGQLGGRKGNEQGIVVVGKERSREGGKGKD